MAVALWSGSLLAWERELAGLTERLNGSIRRVLKHLPVMLEQSPFDNGLQPMPRPAK